MRFVCCIPTTFFTCFGCRKKHHSWWWTPTNFFSCFPCFFDQVVRKKIRSNHRFLMVKACETMIFVGSSPIFVGFSPIFVGSSPIFVGFSPIFVGFSPIFVGSSPIFVGFHPFLLVFTHFCWVFTHFCWVFTHFCWVFSHFCWVFSHFCWFSHVFTWFFTPCLPASRCSCRHRHPRGQRLHQWPWHLRPAALLPEKLETWGGLRFFYIPVGWFPGKYIVWNIVGNYSIYNIWEYSSQL